MGIHTDKRSSGIQSYNADSIGSYEIWFNWILDGNLLLVSQRIKVVSAYMNVKKLNVISHLIVS